MAPANPGAVPVELYVMSQCPFGVEAETLFADVLKKFGSDIDFKVDYIAGKPSPNGELTSMHGPKEVKGDLVQVCAKKLSPANWYNFIVCQNKDKANVDTNWTACAQEVGIPADQLGACADGPEGQQLLSESFQRAAAKQATGSPTIIINGNKYQGARRLADVMRAICGGFSGAKPAACDNIPESPKVNITLIGDNRCGPDCDTRKIEGTIRSKVANPVLTSLDISDPTAKKMFESIKSVNATLPVAIFDKTADADTELMGPKGLGRNLKPAGDLKVLALGGSWNPACADDGGCASDECKNTMQCRPEVPNALEVFVMSQCPFGVKGLDAMKEVLENYKKANASIDFKVNYIGDGDAASGLKSMHGQGEVDEDLREVCAIEHYKADLKFMDYIWCRNKNIKDTNWQSCTGGDTGIDTDVIKTCSEGDEGKKLLTASFAYSKSLGIGASPTWLANGKFKFSGIDPETIKTNVCNHNKLGGCENKLSGPPPRPAGNAPAQPGCGG
ncbi:MAG: DsbA family protein [Polyangiaceae bacterium]